MIIYKLVERHDFLPERILDYYTTEKSAQNALKEYKRGIESTLRAWRCLSKLSTPITDEESKTVNECIEHCIKYRKVSIFPVNVIED